MMNLNPQNTKEKKTKYPLDLLDHSDLGLPNPSNNECSAPLFLIHGDPFAFKSTLALQYIDRQLQSNNEDKHFLYIDLGQSVDYARGAFSFLENVDFEIPPSKAFSEKVTSVVGKRKATGYYLGFYPGLLLEEELVAFVDRTIRKKPKISTIVIDNLGHLTMQYPIIGRQIMDGTSSLFPVLRDLFQFHNRASVFICDSDTTALQRFPYRIHELIALMSNRVIEVRNHTKDKEQGLQVKEFGKKIFGTRETFLPKSRIEEIFPTR